MKLNDAVWGAVLILFSAAILLHVRGFPTIPGQNVGPALFPGVLASCLAVCGALLVVKGLAARGKAGEDARWLVLDGWTRSRRHVVAFVAVIGVNVLYILVVDKLGFLLTGPIYLLTLFTVFGVRTKTALPLAVLLTLGVHYAFYKLLRVPLPWGIFERFAW